VACPSVVARKFQFPSLSLLWRSELVNATGAIIFWKKKSLFECIFSNSIQCAYKRMESQRIFTFVADSLRMAVSGEISSIEPDHIPASPTKNLSMKQGSVQSVDIIISEVIDVDFSCYTWPCAAVMAQYIWYNHQMFQGKVLLEISSGACDFSFNIFVSN
jgi:hypothetical protein